MKIKFTGEFATLTGKKEVELYGPTNIKQLFKALDNSFPNFGWDNSNVAIDGVDVQGSSNIGTYGNIGEITFHQPKMPPIPEDALVIADYMLMADFVPQTKVSIDVISKGVRRVSNSRDFDYDGPSGGAQATEIHSTTIASSFGYRTYLGGASGASSIQLPFFGKSFTHRKLTASDSATAHTYTVDGGGVTDWTIASGGNVSGTSGSITVATTTGSTGYVTFTAGASVVLEQHIFKSSAAVKVTYPVDPVVVATVILPEVPLTLPPEAIVQSVTPPPSTV
jgi:hypothetical protein